MTEEKASSLNATAWIVNWVCVVIMFSGLVILGHQITENSRMRNQQVKLLMELNAGQAKDMAGLAQILAGQDNELATLKEALSVSPKDVLPVVKRIEEKLSNVCGLKAVTQERERCASIAEAMGCDAVAREIRSVEVK